MKSFNLNQLSVWLKACRGYSFTASVIPCLTGAGFALYLGSRVDWLLLPVIIICAVLMHAATNLTNDYYDFKKGVDQNYPYASGRCLVDGVLKPKQARNSALILFTLSFILGLILVAQRGPWMLALGIAGICGGYFYTAMPIGYKYLGLGDMLVFLLMGPFMAGGSFFALTGNFDIRVIWVSLPAGCLVTAILVSNNIRDIIHDRKAGIKTFAVLIGYENAKKELYLLIASSYLCIAILVISKTLPAWSIAAFFSLPLSLKIIKEIQLSRMQDAEKLALIDIKTAQLHLIFGLLLLISLILGKFTGS